MYNKYSIGFLLTWSYYQDTSLNRFDWAIIYDCRGGPSAPFSLRFHQGVDRDLAAHSAGKDCKKVNFETYPYHFLRSRGRFYHGLRGAAWLGDYSQK